MSCLFSIVCIIMLMMGGKSQNEKVKVLIEPAIPNSTNSLTCKFAQTGENIMSRNFELRWKINGKDAGPESPLTSGFKQGDTVTCEISVREKPNEVYSASVKIIGSENQVGKNDLLSDKVAPWTWDHVQPFAAAYNVTGTLELPFNNTTALELSKFPLIVLLSKHGMGKKEDFSKLCKIVGAASPTNKVIFRGHKNWTNVPPAKGHVENSVDMLNTPFVHSHNAEKLMAKAAIQIKQVKNSIARIFLTFNSFLDKPESSAFRGHSRSSWYLKGTNGHFCRQGGSRGFSDGHKVITRAPVLDLRIAAVRKRWLQAILETIAEASYESFAAKDTSITGKRVSQVQNAVSGIYIIALGEKATLRQACLPRGYVHSSQKTMEKGVLPDTEKSWYDAQEKMLKMLGRLLAETGHSILFADITTRGEGWPGKSQSLLKGMELTKYNTAEIEKAILNETNHTLKNVLDNVPEPGRLYTGWGRYPYDIRGYPPLEQLHSLNQIMPISAAENKMLAENQKHRPPQLQGKPLPPISQHLPLQYNSKLRIAAVNGYAPCTKAGLAETLASFLLAVEVGGYYSCQRENMGAGYWIPRNFSIFKKRLGFPLAPAASISLHVNLPLDVNIIMKVQETSEGSQFHGGERNKTKTENSVQLNDKMGNIELHARLFSTGVFVAVMYEKINFSTLNEVDLERMKIQKRKAPLNLSYACIRWGPSTYEAGWDVTGNPLVCQLAKAQQNLMRKVKGEISDKNRGNE
eukprot:g5005.t1